MPTEKDPLLNDFLDQGFVRLPQLFSERDVEEMRAAFEGMLEVAEEVLEQHLATHQPPPPGGKLGLTDRGARLTYTRAATGDTYYIRHIAQCGAIAPSLDTLGKDRRLLAVAARLLGSETMEQLINQAHFKQPGSPVDFAWHQDATHRGMGTGGFQDLNGRGSYVQIAIALDAVTADNGPLQFIPGSNHLGHLSLNDDNREQLLAEKVDLATAVAPQLAPGDAVAFGPYTLHGSEANTSDRWRRVFINGFAYPGASTRDYHLPTAGRILKLS